MASSWIDDTMEISMGHNIPQVESSWALNNIWIAVSDYAEIQALNNELIDKNEKMHTKFRLINCTIVYLLLLYSFVYCAFVYGKIQMFFMLLFFSAETYAGGVRMLLNKMKQNRLMKLNYLNGNDWIFGSFSSFGGCLILFFLFLSNQVSVSAKVWEKNQQIDYY